MPDTVNHYFQPAEAQGQMVTHLPRTPHVIRLDTGHIPAVTDPERFAGLLRSVLP